MYNLNKQGFLTPNATVVLLILCVSDETADVVDVVYVNM
jgi:hypothetical protein